MDLFSDVFWGKYGMDLFSDVFGANMVWTCLVMFGQIWYGLV